MAQITKTQIIKRYIDKIRELLQNPITNADQISIYIDLIEETMNLKTTAQ